MEQNREDSFDSNDISESDLENTLENTLPTKEIQPKKANNKYIQIFILFLFICYYNNSNNPCSLIINTTMTKIENKTHEIVEVINWWEKYNTECCMRLYSNNLALDCLADGSCYAYLYKWLLNFNKTFVLSSISKRCCYSYRPFGAKMFTNYCSFQCLNTEKVMLGY